MQRKYGWRKDSLDFRDAPFVPKLMVTHLPESIDLEPLMPPVYDQGQIGSCTANALAGVMEYERKKQQGSAFTPSRLFIYYNERVIEGTTESDSGAELRDGIKTLSNKGVCPEDEWPYDISKFTVMPPKSCYDEAANCEAIKYFSIRQRIHDLQSCLAEGNPFTFGFSVFEFFESREMATTGILKVPTKNENFLGGHAVVGVGYDNSKKCFKVRNSWGANWAPFNGYFYMPYDYILNANLASDFWKVTKVEE